MSKELNKVIKFTDRIGITNSFTPEKKGVTAAIHWAK